MLDSGCRGQQSEGPGRKEGRSWSHPCKQPQVSCINTCADAQGWLPSHSFTPLSFSTHADHADGVSPMFMSYLEPQNLNLCGNIIFADVIR